MMGRVFGRWATRVPPLVAASAALLSVGAAWAGSSADLFDALRLGRPTSRLEAPDFDLATLGPRSVRLADLRGRPILLYFWASW
jgi:hypothetical protein